jgi:hypothetical protein
MFRTASWDPKNRRRAASSSPHFSLCRANRCKPQDYLIRVNRQPAASDQVLQEGDRVSLTPVKIEGALA